MNFKILLKLTIILMLSLTLISCVSASDVNETVIVNDNIEEDSIEETYICEEIIVDDDVSEDQVIEENVREGHTSAADNDIIYNNYTVSGGHDFEVISHDNNHIEFDKETSEVQYSEELVKINDNFNNNDFVDIHCEINEELNFDLSHNTLFLFSTHHIADLANDNAYFEISVLKTTDFNNIFFKDVKIKNSFSLKHDLIVYEYTHNVIDDLDFNVVVCCNKATDDFAYSINNAVIGDESIVFCNTGSFFVNLNFVDQHCLFFNNFNIFDNFFPLNIIFYNDFSSKTNIKERIYQTQD